MTPSPPIVRDRGGVARFVGGAIAVVGFVFFCMGAAVATWPDEHASTQDGLITLVVGLVLFVPGAVVRRSGWLKQRRARLEDAVLEFVVARQRVRVSELAAAVGISETEASRLLDGAIRRSEANLVLHEDSREYLHRNVLESLPVAGASRCPTCNALDEARVALPGDLRRCQYCGGALSAVA